MPAIETSAPREITAPPAPPHEARAGIGQGPARARQPGQCADCHELNEKIDHRDHGDSNEEGPRYITARVADLAAGDRRHLESAEGIDQQQHRDGKLPEGWVCRQGVAAGVEKKDSHADEEAQRDQLGDGEEVAHVRRVANPGQIDRGKSRDDEADDAGAPGPAGRAGPEEAEVVHQEVTVRRERGEPSHPDQPADLETDDGAEGLAGVEIGPAGFTEPAPDLGEAQDDEGDDERANDKGDEAERADAPIHLARQPEDARPDDGVDGQRDKVPPADRPDETGSGWKRQGLLRRKTASDGAG